MQHDQRGQHVHSSGSILLDRGWRYDLEVWFTDTFVLRGEIKRLRERVIDLVDPSPGQRVLDVGCGTGTLAIRMAGDRPGVRVSGIEPAPRQLSRARSKARRAGLDIDLQSGVIEDLQFADGAFDAVTTTLMMHHLPVDTRRQGLTEISRVLKPEGCLVVADFDHGDGQEPAVKPPGFEDTRTLRDAIEAAGFADVRVEHVRFARQHRGWVGASIIRAIRL